jgi:penicillin-binding protein 1A
MKDSTAFMISDMLKSVLVYPGTGTRAKVPGLPIAGKTGTTNYTDEEIQKWDIPSSRSVPDAWFTGYTTNYTASIWTGYKDRSTPINAVGNNQRLAQLIFKNLMEYVSKDIDTPDFKMPNSVQRVSIERGSMPPVLASQYTPNSQIITEYAVKGHAPKRVSQRYDKLAAPKKLNAKYDEASKSIGLSWKYTGSNKANVTFAITVDGGTGQKQYTQSETSLTIPAEPGAKYTITVIAISGSRQSDPATTTLEVPLPTEEVDPGNGTDPGNGNGTVPGNGNGTEPGNGNGTVPGNGNGTNPGNGNGNGNDDGADEDEADEGEDSGTTSPDTPAGNVPGDGTGLPGT